MKLFILGCFFLIGFSGFAQKDNIEKNENKNSNSLCYETDQSQSVTLLTEYSGRKIFGFNGSLIRQLGLSSIKIGHDGINNHNIGFTGGSGIKLYFNKNQNQGFNIRNLLTFNFYPFKEQTGSTGYFTYISFVNPTFGYKFKIQKVIIEPYLGCNWSILIPIKGTTDRESFNNFMPKFGISIGL